MQDGKAGSPQDTENFMPLLSGDIVVNVSGQEIGERAESVEENIGREIERITSTILDRTQSSHTLDSSLATLCYYVILAIESCIPEDIRGSLYDLRVTSRSGWTRIPWKIHRMLKEGETMGDSATYEEIQVAEEECPDGPRYAAIGNSIAVPCLVWIGQRLMASEREK